MTKTLSQRLKDAKQALEDLDGALGRNPNKVPEEAERSFLRIAEHRRDIGYWGEMIEARASAFDFLRGLERRADSEDGVDFGGKRIKYQHARLLGVQAYMACSWSLADRITGLVGRILCTPNAGLDESRPAELVELFVEDDRKKDTAAALLHTVRLTFGWPICLSYAIRNHFLHDGAQFKGADFFEGPTRLEGFRISGAGMDLVTKRAEGKGAASSFHRSAGWPTTPRDDLRALLEASEREIDDALGVLLGSACRMLAIHVGFVVGED